MVNKLDKSFYNTVLCQAFSPCGNYLVVGDIYGRISIFHLSKLISPDAEISKEQQTPKSTFTVKENVQINCMLSTNYHLLVASGNEICAYAWKTLKSNKNVSCSWNIVVPNSKDNFETTDVNAIIYFEENDLLYAASDAIYVYKLETRQLLKTLIEHNGYIHSLSRCGSKVVSGGEDGEVVIWDTQTYKVVTKFAPHTNTKIARPELGNWIGAVGCNEDWLLCGGGPRLSIWHFRTLNYSTIFPLEDKGIHVAEIYKEKIMAGGRSNYFYQMNYNGDVICEIPTSAVTVYSVVHQEQPYKALCIAGSSSKIDICSNFTYKDLQLSV